MATLAGQPRKAKTAVLSCPFPILIVQRSPEELNYGPPLWRPLETTGDHWGPLGTAGDSGRANL